MYCLRNESPSDTGDCDANPNYSLSGDSYSDTSDNNSSSFDDVTLSALNEPHNIDFTTEKENRKRNSRKRKTAVPSEWKINKNKLLQNTGHTCGNFKRGTVIPERKIAPLCGATSRLKCYFSSYPSGKDVIFSKDIGPWKILGHK